MSDITEVVDTVSDSHVTPTGFEEGYNEWLDDRARCEQDALEAELEQLAATAEREAIARRTLGKIDPATAPALAALFEQKHGATGFYDVTLDGTVILHGKFYDIDPTELAVLRSYVVEHNAAIKSEQPRWETRVGVAGRKFEASIKSPAGKVIKCGKYVSEREAWEAAALAVAYADQRQKIA
jgi:hypothetical protein